MRNSRRASSEARRSGARWPSASALPSLRPKPQGPPGGAGGGAFRGGAGRHSWAGLRGWGRRAGGGGWTGGSRPPYAKAGDGGSSGGRRIPGARSGCPLFAPLAAPLEGRGRSPFLDFVSLASRMESSPFMGRPPGSPMNACSALRPLLLRLPLLLALAGLPALHAWADPGTVAAPRSTSPEDRMRRRVMGAAEVATGGGGRDRPPGGASTARPRAGSCWCTCAAGRRAGAVGWTATSIRRWCASRSPSTIRRPGARSGTEVG